MSIRRNNRGKLIVEIYDPTIKKKVYIKPRDHGMKAPTSMRQAKALERLAANAIEARTRHGPTRDETLESFFLEPWSQDGRSGHGRWTRDFTARRGESTLMHYRERVRGFAERYRDRTLRSITRAEAREQAIAHEATVSPLRAAWGDAARDRLVDENVFACLGLERRRGRADITVLTLEEVHRLAEIAMELHGNNTYGQEVSAAIIWAAYTMCRPGETFAARRTLLHGDVYHLRIQMNSTLGREAAPKHDSIGAIYVPNPAIETVQRLPRTLHGDDDLFFHTKRGKQYRKGSWWLAWDPIRAQFTRELPDTHHLHQRLAIDPDDKLAFHELRHMGASYALNVLKIAPWVIAKQLRHSDNGALVIKLYGHPTRDTILEHMRNGWGDARRFPRTDPTRQGGSQEIFDDPA
jgi:integrase